MVKIPFGIYKSISIDSMARKTTLTTILLRKYAIYHRFYIYIFLIPIIALIAVGLVIFVIGLIWKPKEKKKDNHIN